MWITLDNGFGLQFLDTSRCVKGVYSCSYRVEEFVVVLSEVAGQFTSFNLGNREVLPCPSLTGHHHSRCLPNGQNPFVETLKIDWTSRNTWIFW